jgi:hypothetical protein
MASALVYIGVIFLILIICVVAYMGLSNTTSAISSKLFGEPSYSSQDPVMLTGGARKWFRGKKMSRNQATGAFIGVVSALIYSLYRSAQHFLLLTGR